MGVTYDAYKNLIENIRKNGYQISNYHSFQEMEIPCILRRNVDFSL